MEDADYDNDDDDDIGRCSSAQMSSDTEPRRPTGVVRWDKSGADVCVDSSQGSNLKFMCLRVVAAEGCGCGTWSPRIRNAWYY